MPEDVQKNPIQPLSAKKFERILLAHGFFVSRQSGSHRIFKHQETGATIPVPFHGKNKPLPIGTCMAIVKQSKLSKDIFQK